MRFVTAERHIFNKTVPETTMRYNNCLLYQIYTLLEFKMFTSYIYDIYQDNRKSQIYFATLLVRFCVQYTPRNMHTVFALLCFVVVIYWLIFPYPSGLLHWHCCNLTIVPVPAKQPWWIWINTSCEFIMNDCITTTKQSITKPCAYVLGYTVQQQGYNTPIITWLLNNSLPLCHYIFKWSRNNEMLPKLQLSYCLNRGQFICLR